VSDSWLACYHPVPSTSPADVLSPREREILQRVIAGQSSKEIAQALYLSPSTVDTYRSRVMTKLEVADLNALLRKCIEFGLTPTS
jgi:DNA-binding CsgD family transcriptional regulator